MSGAFVGLLRPALTYSPLSAILARLERAGVARGTLALSGVEESLGSRLRLSSAGRIEPVTVDDPASCTGPLPWVVLTRSGARAGWIERGYDILGEFDPPGGPRGSELLRSLRAGVPPATRSPPEERLVLLLRSDRDEAARTRR